MDIQVREKRYAGGGRAGKTRDLGIILSNFLTYAYPTHV
jgi:hypothetical protein